MITLKDTGQIARFYDRLQLARPRNLCSLFWSTVVIVVLLVTAAEVILLGLLGAVLWLAGMVHWTLGITLVLIAFCLVGGIVSFCIWFESRPHRPPSQWRQNVTAAYRGFKDKYCPLVSYTK